MIDNNLIKLLHDLMGHEFRVLDPIPKADQTQKKLQTMTIDLQTMELPDGTVVPLPTNGWDIIPEAELLPPSNEPFPPKKKLKLAHGSCCQSYPAYMGLVFMQDVYDEDNDETSQKIGIVYSGQLGYIENIILQCIQTPALKNLIMKSLKDMFTEVNATAAAGIYSHLHGNGFSLTFDEFELTIASYNTGMVGHFLRQGEFGGYDWMWSKRNHMKPTSSNPVNVLLDGDVYCIPFVAATHYLPGDIVLNGKKFTWDLFYGWQTQDSPPGKFVKKPSSLLDSSNYTETHKLRRINLRDLRVQHEAIQNQCEICKMQTPLFSDSEQGHLRILKVVK